MHRITFFLFFLSIKVTFCQSWTPWETLYSDTDIKVDVSFRNSPTACDASVGKSSKYRYNITGNLRSYVSFVNWKMEYTDCNGLLYEVTNSINIGKNGIDGIIENMDYIFPSALAKIVYGQTNTSTFEKKEIRQVKIQPTTLPSSIDGQTDLIKGEKTTLSIKGGILGTSGEWKWYEGKCSGKLIGTGTSLTVSPTKSTRFYLRAESPYSVSQCIHIDITVRMGTKMPSIIEGNEYSCVGEIQILKITDGILGDETTWIWYQDSCGGKEVGRGTEIIVGPQKRTTYYVGAVGKYSGGNCIKKEVKLSSKSQNPISINSSLGNVICQGERTELTVIGGYKSEDAEWIWYETNCGYSNILGRGENIFVQPNSTTNYYVRAEGVCNTTTCSFIVIQVTGKPLTPLLITKNPTNVYKNRTVKLTVTPGAGSEETEWVWINGNCSQGKRVGSGLTINVKCNQITTYSVYGKKFLWQ